MASDWPEARGRVACQSRVGTLLCLYFRPPAGQMTLGWHMCISVPQPGSHWVLPEMCVCVCVCVHVSGCLSLSHTHIQRYP